MLEMGVPVGAGSDASRVACYNPFVSLDRLSTGKTVGGLSLYPDKALLFREEALRLYTNGSAWMSREQETRGTLSVGKFADVMVLTADYFSIPDEEIKSLESVLTILGGKSIYAAGEFAPLDPGVPPAMPEWSRVRSYPGYWKANSTSHFQAHAPGCGLRPARHRISAEKPVQPAAVDAWPTRPDRRRLRMLRVLNVPDITSRCCVYHGSIASASRPLRPWEISLSQIPPGPRRSR